MAPAGPFHAAYLALNRGKHFVEVDYKTAGGRLELHDLVASADVFLHNARPGRAERLGVDFDSVQRSHPGIVHAQLAGWDPDGPRAGEVAGDYIVQADSGCGSGLNASGEPPFPSPVTLLDVMAGLLASEGVLAGLLRRAVRQRGASVRTTLSWAAAELQRDVVAAVATGREDGRAGGAAIWGPLDRPIPASDGHLVVSVRDGAARLELATACGAPPSASDDELASRLAGSAAESEEHLGARGVPAARVRADLAELARDDRVSGSLEALPGGGNAPAPPWRFAA
jgi:crotonobetainyl-CoA:carnitine CoA-transferase CaiB-like acyl-CoA transferase